MKKLFTFSLAMLIACGMMAQNGLIPSGKKLNCRPSVSSRIHSTDEAKNIDGQKTQTRGALNETFEVSVPPAGWSKTAIWGISSSGEEAFATGNTGHYAYFDAYNNDAGAEGSLVTPILQPVSGNNTLSYKVNLYKVSTNSGYKGLGAKLYIEFSTNGGVSWTTSNTNVLASLSNYNNSSTGWTTLNVSLASYDNQNVQVRFRAVSDYGWCNIGLDAVTGPNIFILTNDLAINRVFADMNGFDYFEFIPNSQISDVFLGAEVINNGSATQNNVTLHANINNGAFTSASGPENPLASLAAAAKDTLWTTLNPTAITNTLYGAKIWVTQTETDGNLNNNTGDSVYFNGTNTSYLRSLYANSLNHTYFDPTNVPPAAGFEFGSTYYMQNADRVDSISVAIYHASGSTASITGKLYTIDINNGTKALVAQTAPYTPTKGTYNDNIDFTNIALTTPYSASAGTLLLATVQLNGNYTTGTKDTIFIVSDGEFEGNASIAGQAYVNVSGTMGWYDLGYVPMVGIELMKKTDAIENSNNESLSVFPNPAKGHINIDNIGKDAKVTILNSIGQVVFNTVASEKIKINTSGFNKGIYFVKVNESTSKVIVE